MKIRVLYPSAFASLGPDLPVAGRILDVSEEAAASLCAERAAEVIDGVLEQAKRAVRSPRKAAKE